MPTQDYYAYTCTCGKTFFSESVFNDHSKQCHPPAAPVADPVNHPPHYNAHPSGVECIQITEHMGFCLGNAIKYIWRADLKNDAQEDLRKAIWYLERELSKREAQGSSD